MTDGERLVAWFRAAARPLPWRTTPRDPYRSLVSELMAQQTQLDRVVPRFEAFVRRFPDLDALAGASEDEVLEAWSGLGYYRRARLLHRLAREVASDSGELPSSSAELVKLPGIGPYTAAALASIVFGEATPVLDGNVARVAARVLALSGNPKEGQHRRQALGWVGELIADASPGEVNEGLMELGARVCTPKQPRCDQCPLSSGCRARLGGDPTAYPRERPSKRSVELCWLAVIAENPVGRWLLRRVVDGPILRGLWLPPFAELDPARPLERQVAALLPFRVAAAPQPLPSVRHGITHRKIEVVPVRIDVDASSGAPAGFRWADPRSPNLPTSSLLGKLVQASRS